MTADTLIGIFSGIMMLHFLRFIVTPRLHRRIYQTSETVNVFSFLSIMFLVGLGFIIKSLLEALLKIILDHEVVLLSNYSTLITEILILCLSIIAVVSFFIIGSCGKLIVRTGRWVAKPKKHILYLPLLTRVYQQNQTREFDLHLLSRDRVKLQLKVELQYTLEPTLTSCQTHEKLQELSALYLHIQDTLQKLLQDRCRSLNYSEVMGLQGLYLTSYLREAKCELLHDLQFEELRVVAVSS